MKGTEGTEDRFVGKVETAGKEVMAVHLGTEI